MGRRQVLFTQDSIVRAIKGVQKAGIEIRTIRIEPDGTVIINGEEEAEPGYSPYKKQDFYL